MPVFTDLWNRMDEDEEWYKLTPFMGEGKFNNLYQKGYRYYTTNEPRVYADKLKASIFTAEVNVKIPTTFENEEQRIHNQVKKKLRHGRPQTGRQIPDPTARWKTHLPVGSLYDNQGMVLWACST